MSINKVLLTGNLTRDCELRQTGSTTVATLGLAVNDRVKDSTTGEWEDYANFINCVMFGRRAEGISPYLKKGTKVAIGGRLRYSAWETEGQKRNKIEVIVDEIELMNRASSQGASSQPSPSASDDVFGGDVPFM